MTEKKLEITPPNAEHVVNCHMSTKVIKRVRANAGYVDNRDLTPGTLEHENWVLREALIAADLAYDDIMQVSIPDDEYLAGAAHVRNAAQEVLDRYEVHL